MDLSMGVYRASLLAAALDRLYPVQTRQEWLSAVKKVVDARAVETELGEYNIPIFVQCDNGASIHDS
jgi:hypothetical protein